MSNLDIKKEIAELVEFIETASEQELDEALRPVMFRSGFDARCQGLNNTVKNKQGLSPRDSQIWTDGWITKDYQLWLDSKLDLIDWLEKNDRELK